MSVIVDKLSVWNFLRAEYGMRSVGRLYYIQLIGDPVYFEDKSHYSFYLKTPIHNVLNVGWLDGEKSFQQGEVGTDKLKKLAEILTSTGDVDVHVNWARSLDPCGISGRTGLKVEFAGKTVDLGGSEFWLPSPDGEYYFASPSLIYHYIKEHNYLPPSEFLDAVDHFDMGTTYKAQDVYSEHVKGHF